MAKRKEDEAVLLCMRKFAAALGVKRRHVARCIMTEGVRQQDYVFLGARMVLTKKGAELVGMKLQAALPRGLEKNAAADDAGAGVSVRVFKTPFNRKVLVCRRLDTNALVSVGVRDNLQFRVNDEFEAMETGGGLAFYGRWPEAGW